MSDNIFICKICNKSFNNIYSFSSHIKNEHKPLTAKLYYDKYLKKENEGICPICGKITKYESISKGYKRFCSTNCAHKSPEIKEKYKQTCLERYGVTSTNKLQSMKDKSKQTCLEKYGTEFASQSEEFKEQSRKTCLVKYGTEYSIKSKNNIEKTKQTCLEKYGVDHYSKSTDFKEKFKNTCQERYGVNAPAQCPEIYQKVKETCLKKYNVENYAKTEEFKEKFKDTCLEKYGVENPIQNKEIMEKRIITCQEKYNNDTFLGSDSHLNNMADIREKIEKTCLKKYGVTNAYKLKTIQEKAHETCLKNNGTTFPAQNYEIFKKSRSKYKYNNIMFDSSWELAYYIWLTDHKIEFEYQPNIKFKYIANEKEHFYYPDFKINDELIEIKGDHFFDKNGNFRCPFNILNENIQNEYKAKYQCMLDNNIKILRKNEIRNIFYYIEKTYGKHYLKQFKNHK